MVLLFWLIRSIQDFKNLPIKNKITNNSVRSFQFSALTIIMACPSKKKESLGGEDRTGALSINAIRSYASRAQFTLYYYTCTASATLRQDRVLPFSERSLPEPRNQTIIPRQLRACSCTASKSKPHSFIHYSSTKKISSRNLNTRINEVKPEPCRETKQKRRTAMSQLPSEFVIRWVDFFPFENLKGLLRPGRVRFWMHGTMDCVNDMTKEQCERSILSYNLESDIYRLLCLPIWHFVGFSRFAYCPQYVIHDRPEKKRFSRSKRQPKWARSFWRTRTEREFSWVRSVFFLMENASNQTKHQRC